jgi:hypothetical protein
MGWLGDLFGGLIGDALADRGVEVAAESVLGVFGVGEGGERGSEGYNAVATYDRMLTGERKTLDVNDR